MTGRFETVFECPRNYAGRGMHQWAFAFKEDRTKVLEDISATYTELVFFCQWCLTEKRVAR